MHNKNYKYFRIYGYPGFGLLLYLILVLLNPFERTYNSWKLYFLLDFVFEFTITIAYAALLFEVGIQLTKLLNKWYPWETRTKRRFGIQLSLQVTIIYFVVNVFFKFKFPARFGYDELFLRQTIIVGAIFSLLITAVFAAEYFFYRWKDAGLRSLELEQLTTQAQLEALKLQLDPHFLFNNLSIVTALIEDQPATAVSYVLKLSSIYRYMLTNRTQDTITLAEELGFIESYLYLYKIRFGEGIIVKIGDSKKARALRLPPLTLQLLIENAIKHNTFTEGSPLFIHIYFPNGQSMVVENNKIPKTFELVGTKVGLKNIKERYRLLNQEAPHVTDEENLFKVEVPLFAN
ncbi:sensor histidine kinase [Pedobacter suwonensis]|uniref:sensor histidine kinase n=1 Tax=Pedobacter suwonensis TaxID=332999 RepID=UPI0036A94289